MEDTAEAGAGGHEQEGPRAVEMSRRIPCRDEIDWCRCGKCRSDLLVQEQELNMSAARRRLLLDSNAVGEGNY